MANNSKRNSNRAGAVLITVLTVACFAAILLTAVLTFVKRAHTNAFNNYNSEQAYYIASSALGSVHDFFEQEKADNYPSLVAYANASPTGTEGTITLGDSAIDSVIPGGDCKVNVSKVNDGYIRLSVTGYYNGQAETINAYYAVTPGQKASGIDNALYSHGEAKFNQQCSNTGSVTTGGAYVTTNGSSSSGSIICGLDFLIAAAKYRWVSDPNGLASSYIVTQGSFFVKNDGATFIPNIAKKDDNTSLFISIGRALFESVSITIGDQSADNEMDVYCNTAFLGAPSTTDYYRTEYYSGEYPYSEYGGNWNDYFAGGEAMLTMCGNLYCYKIEDAGSHDYNNAQDGDLIINSDTAGLDLEGDVFVEGDIIIRKNNKSIKIKKLNGSDPNSKGGTLYVSPDTDIINATTGTVNDGSRVECYAISGAGLTYEKVKAWIDAGVLKFTGITNPTEDNLKDRIKTDPINHGSATSRNYKPAVEFDPNYIKNYETTPEFLNQSINATIKSKYTNALLTNMDQYKQTTKYTDPELGLEFDYVIDGDYITDHDNGCLMDQQSYEGKKILVDMNEISGDYVIRVKCTTVAWDGKQTITMPTIIVKNGERKADGTWVSNDTKGEGCLYIIPDDMSGNLNYRFFKAGIMDYYTYKFVMKNDWGLNVGGYDKNGLDGNELNAPNGYFAPNGSEHGIYTPPRTRIFLMLNPGDTMQTENANNPDRSEFGLIEAVVYAPQASCDIKTYGANNLLFLRDNTKNVLSYLTSVDNPKACLSILGAIICDQFTGDENFGVGFVPPSSDTNLGGGGAPEDVGSVTFSHYESR